jgi:hypothetical protein
VLVVTVSFCSTLLQGFNVQPPQPSKLITQATTERCLTRVANNHYSLAHGVAGPSRENAAFCPTCQCHVHGFFPGLTQSWRTATCLPASQLQASGPSGSASHPQPDLPVPDSKRSNAVIRSSFHFTVDRPPTLRSITTALVGLAAMP